MSTTTTDNSAAPRGFDSPVASRQDDHLNRWPLAREIFGIATTGPKAWSVRVGIYGEWGTGKTSVLRFVDSMASQAGHIVIWFDPWEHSTKQDLWQGFVLTVFNQLERKLGEVPDADRAKRKAWMKKAKGIVGAIAGVANDKAGKAVEAGLDLVKKHFAFSHEDLASLQSILGDRRIIVLIDDLDRTTPELVPEILFALKELTDIPSFSFICAFDPVAVGEVLGKYHPGFGDGINFLDKIIDYPRWLPKASDAGLVRMATADAAIACPFVPAEAVADAIRLLPTNPRAVRQFIRLLALLKPQVARHHPNELHWPVIITANVLKVRHPRIAHELLNDGAFWRSIEMISLSVRGENEPEQTAKAVSEHIASICTETGASLSEGERSEITDALVSLCSQIGLFGRLNEESAIYQFNLAETPTAVTWKEFDAFLIAWPEKQSLDTVKTWIRQHALTVEREEVDVYRELLQAAIQSYATALNNADNVFTAEQSKPLVELAESLFVLLNTLVFQIGRIGRPEKWIGNAQLEQITDSFARMAEASRPVHALFWPGNEALLVKLFDQWSADVTPLIKLLQPHAGHLPRDCEGKAASELHKKLCAAVLPHFAQQIVASFRKEGFIHRLLRKETDAYEVQCVVLDVSGALWTGLRNDVLGVLAEASSNKTVQENAYELLHGFILASEGHRPEFEPRLQHLFSDQVIFDAVWKAATASELGDSAVYRLRELPTLMNKLGIKCPLPGWWSPIVATFTVPAPPQQPDKPQPADPAEDLA